MTELLDYEREHLNRLRSELAECTVLLKSDGSFPLKEAAEVALYGSGARHTVKGGTGSGEVNSRFFVTVEEGLENAGFRITTKGWLYSYDQVRKQAKSAFVKQVKAKARREHRLAIMDGMGAVMPEPEYSFPFNGTAETAVYVLARISGEGNDRQNVPGDIAMTETEVRDILQLQKQYAKFMLVLNVGGPVDLTPVVEKVGNILLLSQLGTETGAVLADILLGKSNPSGKLTTTWAAFGDYQSVGDFGDRDNTRYKEGIYVGYRYFDSAGIKPLFPFGYGLSYSDFTFSEQITELHGNTVTVSAKITNNGKYPGKETLQLYVSKPEVELDQPFQVLAAFTKTGMLAPLESETVTLSFLFSDLSSYDSRRECYILENGDYFLRIGTSSVDTSVLSRLRLNEDIITKKVKNTCGVPDFTDWKPKLERIDMFLPDVPILEVDAASIPKEEAEYRFETALDPDVKNLSTDQIILLNVGSFDQKAGITGVIGNASLSVAGAAGETSGVCRDLGLKPLVMADGPAGLRLSRDYVLGEKGPETLGSTMPETMLDYLPKPLQWAFSKKERKPKREQEILHQYTTAIPIGTAIAQTWNPEFAIMCGDIVGDEMERMKISLWLAPALNIHRDIRCGRNFEYFSEDPLLSGIFASAITEGVQAHRGCGVTIKHFAANNQEYNRYNSNSIVSERAMREIYLKGFEICIREAHPHALMTSYNLLNGCHTSEHKGLLTDILRCEFGFEGLVMTDWVMSMMSGRGSVYPGANAGRAAMAGGDLFMPGSKSDTEQIRKALKNGLVTEQQLREAASRTIRKVRELNNS